MPKRKPVTKAKKTTPRSSQNPSGNEHIPTAENRALVQTLTIAGWAHDRIGYALDIDDKTLRKHYRRELDLSKARVDAQVTQTIVMMACGGPGKGDWTKAVPSMAAFYAKTRMGWKDPKLEINHTGSIGQYDMTKLSDADLKRVTDILARAEISAAGGFPGGDSET